MSNSDSQNDAWSMAIHFIAMVLIELLLSRKKWEESHTAITTLELDFNLSLQAFKVQTSAICIQQNYADAGGFIVKWWMRKRRILSRFF